MHIPFVNLPLQYKALQQEIDHATKSVFEAAQFIGGEFVEKFEKEFAQTYHQKHCIGTGNGTDALFIILKALGIGPGDEVITPAFSCIASAETISLTGATVMFADVDADSYTLSILDVQKKITSKTKAVIAVHLYGQAAAVSELKKVCDQQKIWLIEDCAQAHLTEENKKLAGTFGIASAFSFYPTKNLGAYGDAGCVLTSDDSLAEKLRRLGNHGALKKDDHNLEGSNSRLDTLQAAVLSVKLKYLPSWNAKRIQHAERYTSLLNGVSGVQTPMVRPDTKHTFHIYAIRTQQRNELKEFLSTHGIETMIHYPKGLPFTPAYTFLHHSPTDFPITAQLQDELLSLPVYPELSEDTVTYIAEKIRHFFFAVMP